MNRKRVGVAAGLVTSGALVAVLVMLSLTPVLAIFLYGKIGISFELPSIHGTVTFYKDGELYAQYSHPGVLTNLGRNFTLAKLTGDSWYNLTWYNWNLSYISIGNQGTLSASSTVLPGEWNRTTATIQNQTYNQFNMTATFYPDAGGPYTADCIGVNFGSATIGADDTLWGYDTFTEVTGIDDAFTVNVEFQISVTYQ